MTKASRNGWIATLTLVGGLALAVVLPTQAGAAEGPAPAPAPAAPKTPDELVQHLKTQSDPYFESSVQELQSLGVKAVPALTAALKDANPNLRGRAAAMLAGIGPAAKDAVPSLIPLVADGTTAVRVISISALSAIGSDAAEAVPALTKALADPMPEVRRATAEALGRLGAPAKSALPALAELAQKDANAEVKATAAKAVEALGGGGAAAPVAAAPEKAPAVPAKP